MNTILTIKTNKYFEIYDCRVFSATEELPIKITEYTIHVDISNLTSPRELTIQFVHGYYSKMRSYIFYMFIWIFGLIGNSAELYSLGFPFDFQLVVRLENQKNVVIVANSKTQKPFSISGTGYLEIKNEIVVKKDYRKKWLLAHLPPFLMLLAVFLIFYLVFAKMFSFIIHIIYFSFVLITFFVYLRYILRTIRRK